MIDAGPSLRAAEGLPASALLLYLRSAGWSAKPSRVPGVTILSRLLPDADGPIHIILPDIPGFADEQRRVADALRTIEAVEERPMTTIVSEVLQIAAGRMRKPASKTLRTAKKKRSPVRNKKVS
jgi:hypothetical protein